MEKIVTAFLEYGLLGLVTLIAMAWAYRMYKDVKVMRLELQNAIKDLNEIHQADQKALQDRYITKAETWMQQYYELAQAQNEVLESMERRYGR